MEPAIYSASLLLWCFHFKSLTNKIGYKNFWQKIVSLQETERTSISAVGFRKGTVSLTWERFQTIFAILCERVLKAILLLLVINTTLSTYLHVRHVIQMQHSDLPTQASDSGAFFAILNLQTLLTVAIFGCVLISIFELILLI